MIKSLKKLMFFPLIILVISGCSNSKDISIDKIDFNKTDIGVIETSTFNNTSYLNLYNSDGKKTKENSINCTDVNSGFFSPITYNNKVYTNSIGGYSNRSNKVVEFDLNKNKYSTYEIDYGVFSVAANDEYIFTSSSPPKGSIITKYNIKKKSVAGTLTVPGLVQHINITRGLLYAFSDSDEKDGNIIISIINPNTLKIEKSIKIKCDLSVFDSINISNFIYFTHMMSSDDTAPSKILSKLNIDDGTITNIGLAENYSNQIKAYKSFLLITHYNIQTSSGNKLTVLNLNTNEQKVITFVHNLKQIEVRKDKLYATDGNNMYIYNVANFKLLNKFKVSADKSDYKISSFFFTK